MHTQGIARATLPALLASLATGFTAPAQAAPSTVVVPKDTVLRLRLDQHLSSEDARVGQTFASILDSDDRSGFPQGSRFQGVVTEVRRHTKTQPAVLNVEIRRAYLPNGAKVAVTGRLASLDEKSIERRGNGRLVSKKGNKPDWKWAGYGAAGGAVLSAILGGNLLKGALLGGLGGGAYSYLTRDKKAKFREVDLERDTEFGARLMRQVAFRDSNSFQYQGAYVATHTIDRNDRDREVRNRDLPDRNARNRDRNDGVDRRGDAVLGRRDELPPKRGAGLVVRLNGRLMSFGDEQPRSIEGTPFVPLERIATASGMRLTYRRGEETFILDTPEGLADGRVGNRRVFLKDRQSIELDEAPMTVNGALFVSPEFLRRVAQMRVDWNSDTRELSLETDR